MHASSLMYAIVTVKGVSLLLWTTVRAFHGRQLCTRTARRLDEILHGTVLRYAHWYAHRRSPALSVTYFFGVN